MNSDFRRYTIKGGGSEHTVPIRLGSGRRYITFRRNGWEGGDASFDTRNERLARAIEASDLWARGLIRLESDHLPYAEADALRREREAAATEPAAEAPSGEEAVTDYTDVHTVSEAKKLLKDLFGIPYSRMRNGEETKRVGLEHGVTFSALS